MDRQKTKHLPVTDRDGRLVGILSRRDLLRPFLRPDEMLRKEVVEDILDRTLWLPSDAVDVTVDGVVAVHQTLHYTSDDSRIDISAAATRGMVGLHSAVTHPK
jgi:CBS-domain-containing membrane protein